MRAHALVVEPRLEDHKVIAVDEVHEPVLAGDPPGPGAGQRVPQRLRLPQPIEGVAHGIRD